MLQVWKIINENMQIRRILIKSNLCSNRVKLNQILAGWSFGGPLLKCVWQPHPTSKMAVVIKNIYFFYLAENRCIKLESAEIWTVPT